MSRYNKRWAFVRWGARWSAIRREAETLLEQAQLLHRRDRLAGTLAYSEQRALEICMTVATGASVILLSGKELARCRTLRLGPFPAPPHQNCS